MTRLLIYIFLILESYIDFCNGVGFPVVVGPGTWELGCVLTFGRSDCHVSKRYWLEETSFCLDTRNQKVGESRPSVSCGSKKVDLVFLGL
ncbi:hypothetical protein MANES_17G011450v8 [Manihot esculenta]|uniref:Uncharacterized protein n=1 Tax=Manihot esculenta TaxID=3983 RepID=A0ACB7G2H2_MANES|nr:hypothetical protein MANES_17G011450v8 [Manihot esculenta]